MNVGVDLDEVLADFLPSLMDYHNENYGTDFKKEDFHSYQFWHVWGGTREEAIQKYMAFLILIILRIFNLFLDHKKR